VDNISTDKSNDHHAAIAAQAPAGIKAEHSQYITISEQYRSLHYEPYTMPLKL
jgi:hypothetical protein